MFYNFQKSDLTSNVIDTINWYVSQNKRTWLKNIHRLIQKAIMEKTATADYFSSNYGHDHDSEKTVYYDSFSSPCPFFLAIIIYNDGKIVHEFWNSDTDTTYTYEFL